MQLFFMEARDAFRALDHRMEKVENQNERIINVLETKLSELINALRGKDQMPVSTFKWLVLFVIGFSFTTFFGFAAMQYFFDRFTGTPAQVVGTK